MPRKPFSLTYVTYEEGDTVGLLCALLALAPVFIVVAYVTLLARNREAHVLYALAGQLLNWRLNDVLKRYFAAPRPADCELGTYGFPSDHAQFLGFWACYVCAFLARAVPRAGRKGWREILGLGAAALAAAVAAARVYLGYHTLDQVAAGLGVGACTGGAWYALYEGALRRRLGPFARGNALCRYLLVRDGAHEADGLRVEYDAFRRKKVP